MLSPRSSELRKRIISALILAPLALLGLFAAPQPIPQVLVGIAWILSLREWLVMLKVGQVARKVSFGVVGGLYITLGFLGIWLTAATDLKILAFLLAVTWITDTAAFFVGRALKGPKLAPSISPGKTWSGALGGALATATFLAMGISSFNMPFIDIFIIALGASGIAQMGDLLESKAKRILGVKDSGNLIPGHGGILDRLDSLMALGVVMSLFYWMTVYGILSVSTR